MQLWTTDWQEHEAYVGGKGESLGRMGPAVIQEQEIQAVCEVLCEKMHEHPEAVGIQMRPFQEEPRADCGFHSTIDTDPRENVPYHSDGLHAKGCEAPPADGESAAAAFVLAAHPDRTSVRNGNRPLAMCMAGVLGHGHDLRL